MARPGVARLITIPPSHYCEKARWGLDRLGVPYVEEPHVPAAHILATMRANCTPTAPVLITDAGTFGDSTEILRHLDASAPEELRLYPADPAARREVERLEDLADERIGPPVRLWAYAWLLDDREATLRIMDRDVPRAEAWAFRTLTPAFNRAVRWRIGWTPDARARASGAVERALAELDELLADGRRFLVGARFSAADLALASLLAPMVAAPEYGAWLPALADLEPGMRADVERLRATRAGAFALRMYREHRGAALAAAGA